MLDTDPLSSVAHVIQLALTPVFLMTGLGTLLNVFSTRLGRVADQVDAMAQLAERAGPDEAVGIVIRLNRLRRRSLALDVAVVLATIGSVLTGLAILTLFVGSLREVAVGAALFGTFGAAVMCTIFALAAFLAEAVMAGRGLRRQVEVQQREVRPPQR